MVSKRTVRLAFFFLYTSSAHLVSQHSHILAICSRIRERIDVYLVVCKFVFAKIDRNASICMAQQSFSGFQLNFQVNWTFTYYMKQGFSRVSWCVYVYSSVCRSTQCCVPMAACENPCANVKDLKNTTTEMIYTEHRTLLPRKL